MKRPACTVGCCILFFLGLFFYLKPPEAASMAVISGKNIVIAGIVDDKYQRKESTYLTVKEAGIVSGMKSKKKYRVIVKLKEAKKSLAQAPKLGARVIVSGKGLEFSGARNPGNFDLSKYRMIRGIDFEIYGAEAYEASGGHRIRHMDETLCLIRERLSDTIDRIYGSEDGGTVKAMLLGDRSTLDDELQSGYRRGGMSHILCISGLHITLAGMAVLRLIKKTGINKAAAYLTAFSVISLYGRLTGFGISTMRALISFGLMMTAELLGRTADLLSVVAEAGIIIIFIQPLYVLDSGFVLSFSAVCGIGLLGPPLKRLIPLKGSLFESLRTSLAVTLFMLPEVMYFFYQVSLFSVLINLAVIPLLGILLMFSALSA
ncbi:MAG: ComEC/Rec2 family competence protein, partial [Lachnospiraceae bacterium]|nr:ComEC/Rec2 family competence protein [Lachnospiraceae bacterium]